MKKAKHKIRVIKTGVPADSLIQKYLPVDYADSFSCTLEKEPSFSADDIQVYVWTAMPWWVDSLMKLRNFLVRPFGLTTSRGGTSAELEACIREGGRLAFASIPEKSDNETILKLEDKHLNALLSIYISNGEDKCIVTATTLVHFNNRMGPFYFYTIRPFHEIVVRKSLKRALKNLQKA